MSKVLKHAIIYTGLEKIDDGYIRFGKEIEAVGPMDDYVAQPDDDIEFVSGKTIVPGFIDVHSQLKLTKWLMIWLPAKVLRHTSVRP